MRLARRRFLLAGVAAVLSASPQIARAQTYPARPIRLIVGTTAGSSPDIIARLIGQSLSERLGQPLIIDNRPGAGTNIGTQAVVNAAPDGYTLLFVPTANAINATLYDKLNFNFIRDITPVAGVVRLPLIMAVNPSVPAKTVSEFVSYAKANRGQVNMASAGNGTSLHVAGELFKMMTGVSMLPIPYRGEAPALSDLLGGQVQVIFGTMPASIEYIRAGTLRPLAVTTAVRSEMLPNIPTIGESAPGYEASAWYGIGAPRNTPVEIVEKLNKEVSTILADPKMRAQLADLGGTVLVGSPADFGKLIAEETEKWGKVVKFSGAKPD
jgi:tripartite-type tricarboxylate transporter receptor subunit TctC